MIKHKLFLLLLKGTMLNLFLLSILLITIPDIVHASEEDTINEDDLFSDSDILIESEELTDETITEQTKKPGISLSGSIYNTNLYSTKRDEYILKPYIDNDDTYTGNLTANPLLDMRYKHGIKAFVNADLVYYSQGIQISGTTDIEYTDWFLRELFFDFNINRAIYIRYGKQYLKWGRNYFWNPSDLINIDRKDFLDPNKNLEGTQGVKIHIPFGTKYNIYGFANLEDVGVLEDVAWSGKFEFIVGSTEMAFSGWYKKGFEPVFSYDLSTRIFRVDVMGEMSLSHGANQDSLLREEDNEGNVSFTTTRITDEWIPKASIGFMKSFDLFDINDRVTIIGEFYYDHAGYPYNAFDDLESISLLMREDLLKPYHVSKYYASFFTVIQRFIVSDAVFRLNVISNLTDGSGIIYSSLRYNPWYDFFIDLTASVSIGDGRDEFTFMGSDIIIGLEFRYNF